MSENEEVVAVPAAEAQQDVAHASDAKAEAAGTASDELSEDDLEAVAGGKAGANLSPPPELSRTALRSIEARLMAMWLNHARTPW
jgi:hypothetical protein